MTAISSLSTPASKCPVDQRCHRLERSVHEQLRQSGWRPLHGIVCICDGNRCTLTGRLPTFFMKQLAQETAIRVDGIDQIINRIEVVEVVVQERSRPGS